MLKFGFQKAFLPLSHALCYLYYRTVRLSICPFHLLHRLTECHEILSHTLVGHHTTVGFNSITLVKTTWRTREFVNQ